MKLFKINDYIDVVCETNKTRNGFKHTATLLLNGIERESVKICYINRTWESYTYESVLSKLLDKLKLNLSSDEIEQFETIIKNGGEEETARLKTLGTIAKLGEVIGMNQKETNDWKVRMMKAGLEGYGLIMPSDWDTLKEEDKEARLNGAIAQLCDVRYCHLCGSKEIRGGWCTNKTCAEYRRNKK